MKFTNKELAENILSRLEIAGLVENFKPEASDVLADMLDRFATKIASELTPAAPTPSLDQLMAAPEAAPEPVPVGGVPAIGDKVVVVKGRKVAKGTVGTLFWLKEQEFDGKPTIRIGIKDSEGKVHWTYLHNVSKAA